MAVEPSKPGLRNCMNCGNTFRSPDVERIRRCTPCKKKEDGYSTREIRLNDIRHNIHNHFRER